MLALPAQIRSFISIALDPAVAREITRLQHRIEEIPPRETVRWIPAEQLHLTLKFLGNIPGSLVEELSSSLRAICEQYSPLRLRAEGLGCFPNARNPRVIWIGLQGDLQALEQLQEEIERASSRWAEKEEPRRFSPHLTIGRVRENAWREARQIGAILETAAAPTLGAWSAGEVCLMRSQLSPQGAVHTPLATLPLNAPGKP